MNSAFIILSLIVIAVPTLLGGSIVFHLMKDEKGEKKNPQLQKS